MDCWLSNNIRTNRCGFLNWLKDLIEITLSPEELADALTMAGFEV